MKKIILTISFFLAVFFVTAQTNSSVKWQNSYTKKDGTHVKGHYKTTKNKTNHDNFSTKGNTNTYTGNKGKNPKDYSKDSRNSRGGKTIKTGSRGGKYYINSKGNKTYVPKQ